MLRFITFGCGSASCFAPLLGDCKTSFSSTVKLHCSMLAEDAIKAAVKDYQTKRAKSSGVSETEPVEQAAKA
ncbi:hypothetical protein NC653_034947 [Populus alba x Populus x berolinensis]|uniref:NIF system FeS cluster assembly NifU N-terminal domain-containing protein n=1 Tax=Populus alba x Populus x berolinensis TaxID=444605 RepID=A0AAD6PWS5_9ROSI|nr:hypothetical protein NC653_034947 [Populus alba x Populus x berolinensis]